MFPTEEIKAELKNSSESNAASSALPLPKKDTTTVTAEKYFLPFELVCQSKSSRIVVTALDCLQKLIAYGHLTGNVPDSTTQKKFLIDRIVDTICSCFTGPATDDGVQLQIIKALLTVVTSQHVQVHQKTLLNAVKTCYNIYLASKNLVNQTTARATLTQMLNVIFTRMENQALEEQYKNNNQKSDDSNRDKKQSFVNSNKTNSNEIQSSSSSSTEGISKTDDKITENGIANPLDVDVKKEDVVVVPPATNSFDEFPTSEEAFDESVAEKKSDSDIIKEVLNKIITDVESICENGSDTLSVPSGQIEDMNSIENDQSSLPKFTHVLQIDAFLVFRSLCLLSMKSLPEGIPDPK